LQDLYALFVHNSKKFREIHKPINLFTLKATNSFKMSTFDGFPWSFKAKNVFAEYCFLIAKMQAKFVKSEVILKNLISLCDVEFIMRLHCILPLLECVHTLIKFAQHKDVFVHNFMDIFKPTPTRLV
jgi:hypothetical protein